MNGRSSHESPHRLSFENVIQHLQKSRQATKCNLLTTDVYWSKRKRSDYKVWRPVIHLNLDIMTKAFYLLPKYF